MHNEVVREFRRVLRRLEREIGWQLKSETDCCGVTVSQCHIILELGSQSETSLVDLSSTLRLDPSTLSRTINTLVDTGVVNRLVNPDDRRYITLSLTDKGLSIYQSIEAVCNQNYKEIFQMIPEDKHKQIIESFVLFTTALIDYRESGNTCCTPAQSCAKKGDDQS